MVRGSRPAQGFVAGPERGRASPGDTRGARKIRYRDTLHAHQGPQAHAGSRQLRAPDRRVRDARRGVTAGRAGVATDGDESRSLAYSRRADLHGASAGGARPQSGRRKHSALGGGATLRGAGPLAETRLCGDRGLCPASRRALRAARRHTPGARARRRAITVPVHQRSQRPSARSIQAAHRRKPRRIGTPADAACAGELVLRSAQ